MNDTPPRPLKIAHVVVTDRFAGVERYVSDTANELSRRGHQIAVIGGATNVMPKALDQLVQWDAAQSFSKALIPLRRLGPLDVVHVHMTLAEAAGLLATLFRSTALVATRHFAQPRGSGAPGRAFSALFNRVADHQIAISGFVAGTVERSPESVIELGTSVSAAPYSLESRTVLMVQRLEPEKHGMVGLKAWAESGLGREGWRLRLLGEGSELSLLASSATELGIDSSVEFVGWTANVREQLRTAAILLATAPTEPFGLSVIEAMSEGVPVVAAAGGGHLETIGAVPDAPMFEPGNARAAAQALRRLALDQTFRTEQSDKVRAHQSRWLTVKRHVNRLEAVYERVVDAGLTKTRDQRGATA